MALTPSEPRCSDCASVGAGFAVHDTRRAAVCETQCGTELVHGMCESRGHIGRVADDSHARDTVETTALVPRVILIEELN